MDLNILQLESYLNVTQTLIDKLLHEGRTNIDANYKKTNERLSKLNGYKNNIIKEIEKQLDEKFS